MATQAFSLANNLTITNAGITDNGVFTVWTSSNISNNNNLYGLRLVIDYANPNPTDVSITAIVEASQAGMWFPVAYQFNPFNNIDNGPQRIILVLPNTSSDSAGIDDDMYVGNSVIARISRQQGKAGSTMRVRLVAQENNYGLSNQFQSVKVSIYGELFD